MLILIRPLAGRRGNSHIWLSLNCLLMNATTGWLFFCVLIPATAMTQQLPQRLQQQPRFQQQPQLQRSPQAPAHLSGKIRHQTSNEILAGVTVSNRALGQHNISDLGGNYR
ncbi:MAG TPA: hypothetical protein VGS79_26065, partial [Puia sp.]|nr:hypothetical protein [Puia sp.]